MQPPEGNFNENHVMEMEDESPRGQENEAATFEVSKKFIGLVLNLK